MVGLESVTAGLFIEKKAALGSWSGTQREFAMKASVCAMKSLRIETARCELLLREPSQPCPLHTRVTIHPLSSSRWAAMADLAAAVRRSSQMQLRSGKSSPTSSWQVPDFTGLIIILEPTFVGLCTQEFCRIGRH